MKKKQTYGYSRKVLEIFKNPKNIGEIKNPDGFGEVGNPRCLLPGTMIHANDSIIEIQNFNGIKKVLGHNGKFNNIQRRISSNYSGEMILLRNKLGATVLTPDHEILSIKLPAGHRYAYAKKKKTLLPDWNHAESLKLGDIVLYPVMKEVKDRDYIKAPQEKKKWDHRSNSIPLKVPVNVDFLRLCGYYLAEGSLTEKVTKTHIAFTLHEKETDIAGDIDAISRKIFGLPAKIRREEKRKTMIVTINNVFVTRLINSLFGKGAASKKLPHWMMLLPQEKQKSLIYGLWKGDGYFNANRPRAGFVTISYNLAQQVKTLLLRQHIAPSIYTEDPKVTADGVSHKKAYRLHIGERKYLENLAKILSIEFSPKKPEAILSWFNDDFLFTPIKHVDRLRYSGEVYNLEVEGSKSYVTDSLAVHNCGDMMYMYIKVSKDGKERIEDIKIKTFGCLGAISSSSILTEMVKGKTIGEALKTTKDDVVRELEGLPPIKVHCSVLSIDALKEAVYDYYRKKGRKIPKELELVHKHNVAVCKGIEHMH